ncbi:MAG TPA: hypothetical protein PLL36_02510 [Candidatus Hydrogenedentes bacterium]|jgi:lysophospholipase L1-like esterase|nr:MAG: hypothetical protein BWX80_00473 [Candidatus Hydrogenedentes bacterium ADurb.Bin101]HQM99914.1 hypothetical protein [Candidatus Hydrogenedentota bacterium]
MQRACIWAKIALISVITTGFFLTALWGCDKAIPLFRSVPPYYPELSTLASPGNVIRSVAKEFDFIAHINALGLRGPEIDLEEKKAFRIAVYGSSYTYGWGVNEEDSFVFRLGDALQHAGLSVEMINLGRNGGAPPQYAALAAETIPLLKPDLVIVAVGQGCDLFWTGPPTVSEYLYRMFHRYLPNLTALAHQLTNPVPPAPPAPYIPETEEQLKQMQESNQQFARECYKKLPPAQKDRFNALEETIREVFFSGLYNVGGVLLALQTPDLYANAVDPDRADLHRGKKWLKKYLATIARSAREVDAQTLVISVPFGSYVNRPAWERTRRIGFDTPPDMLTSTAMDDVIESSAQDLPFFSTTKAFRDHIDKPDLFFEYDLHMASEGHRLFAQTIAPWVEAHVRTSMNNLAASPATNK